MEIVREFFFLRVVQESTQFDEIVVDFLGDVVVPDKFLDGSEGIGFEKCTDIDSSRM